MIRLLVGVVGLGALVTTSSLAADPVEIGIGYLHGGGVKPTLSLVEQPAENDGLAGARLAIDSDDKCLVAERLDVRAVMVSHELGDPLDAVL